MLFKRFIFFIAFPVLCFGGNPLERIAEWKQLEFDFPTEADRQHALNTGNLIPSNAVPIDVAVTFVDERIFVTVPRFSPGVPFTLATVNPNGLKGPNGPLLLSYPAYSWHNNYNQSCDGIVSAFRVAITECNQMWVIDSGRIGGVQYCPPQLLLFDLNNDKLIHRYQFDPAVYTPSASLFITPIALVRDPRGNCQQTMLYIADVTHHGLVVYDYQQNRAWRVENKWMYPDPDHGTHTIAGESFTLMDGMFALSTDKQNLYFHPLASPYEFSVPINVLNDANQFANGPESQPNAFRKLGSRRSPCGAEAMDSVGNIFCVTFNPIKLIGWNVRSNDYSSRNIFEIPADERLLEFVSGMKVVRNKYGKEELWMMSNRFQKIAAGTINPNEVNFRIVRRTLDDLQRDLHHKLIFS